MNLKAELVLLDFCFWIYVAIALVSIYGFGLFLWWRHMVGRSSEVYNYIMLMMACIFFTYILNAYARLIFITDIDNLNEYESFITNWIWQLRALPNLIVISLIVFRMNQRARKALRAFREPYTERRQNHRRQVDK